MSDFHGEQRIGDWKFVCDYSGFEGWASESVRTWNGLRVLRRFAGEEGQKHPQEFVRAKADKQTVPWTRGEAPDVFLAPGDVTAASL